MLKKSTHLLILLLSLIAAAHACQKDKKASDSPVKDDKKGAESAGASGGFSIERSLPVESSVVFGGSLTEFKATPAYAKLSPLLLAELDEPIKLTKEVCDLDLLGITGSVAFGMRGFDPDGSRDVSAVIQSGWNRQEIESCFGALVKKEDKDELVITNEGKLTRYSKKDKPDEDEITVAWLSDSTVFVNEDKSVVEDVATGKSVLAENKKMMALWGLVDRDATVWAIGLIPAAGVEKFATLVADAEPLGFFAHADFKSDFEATLGFHFASPEVAKRVKTAADGIIEISKARPEMKPFLPYLGKFSLEAVGADVVAKISLSAAQVDELTTIVMTQF